MFSRWHLFDCMIVRRLLDFGTLVGRPHLDHDRHVAKFSNELVWISIVDPVFESRCELAAICRMSLSALGRENLSILCEFVGRRQKGFLQRHAFVANGQFVGCTSRGTVQAIKEGLGPDVCQAMVYETFAPVRGEERIEGLNMWVDGDLEKRVCAVVGRRIPEEVLAAQGVVLVIPLGGRPGWSHGWRNVPELLAKS